MNHQDIDKRSLDLHRIIAAKIEAEPALLNQVMKTIHRWQSHVCASSQPYLQEWEAILKQGQDATIKAMCDDSERGNALRQASPFTSILTNRERFAFFKQWGVNNEAS